MHERCQRAKRISAFDMPGRPGALLSWPFGSPLAWNHALRVTVDGEGLCDVDGLDARASRYRSEEHTSELQSHLNLVCRLLLEKKKVQRISSRLQPTFIAVNVL